MTRMLRIPAVRGQLGRGRTALYDDVKAGVLPPAVKCGSRAVAWPEHEITVIAAARVAGLPDAEIKALVLRLVAERRTRLADILQPTLIGANTAQPKVAETTAALRKPSRKRQG